MAPSPLFHLPSVLRRNRTNAGEMTSKMSSKRNDQETKAQNLLGITETDMRIARNQSITSTTSSRSHNRPPQPEMQAEARGLRRDGRGGVGGRPPPDLELRPSSVLLHEEYLRSAVDDDPTPKMSIKNFASSSTLNSHYDPQKVPMRVSQQTSESSRRDMALHKGSPRVLFFPFGERNSPKPSKSPKPRPGPEGRKLSKQRPRTSETPTPTPDPPNWRPESGYESVPSIKSMNDVSRTPRGSHFTPPKPSSLSRRTMGTTNKALLEPMDPACLKVNVRRPRIGAKHWFDGLEGETSEDEILNEPEFEEQFVSGLESAFRDERIKPPSDQSSIQTDVQGFKTSSSSVTTPKQFLQSTSSVARPSPRVAILNAKASTSSLAQQSTRSQHTSASKRKAIQGTDLTKNSYLDLSGSESEDEISAAKYAVPVRSPQPPQPAIRDSVAMAFNNDSEVEVGTAHELKAKPAAVGAQQPRVRTLKVVNRSSRPDHIQMPVPKRGSSLALSQLYDEAERQSAGVAQESDLIPSFPSTPVESDNSAYRMSISVFSDSASVESRRMMSVTKQEESLLAAMRLKKATMKQTVTRDRRLHALRNLERGQVRTPPRREPSADSMSSFHPRQPVQQLYSRYIDSDGSMSRNSATTIQTSTTARQSQLTYEAPTQVNRLSLSSDNSLDHSVSPSLLSLNTPDRRQSRDTYYSPPDPQLAAPGHSRNRTESSHFSNIVSLDELEKAPASREEIPSQEFIDWPYRGWNARMGAPQGVAH
ncbi:uncharacterized protein HMPREF1541_02847 [Cyphellophora europaea CBS 101466]|uniref:Uncharacterized protein n=1 Tax=Cyphellophora europaea (strain CBS 101466) TaxID=1220924 RepID=W2S6M4_CYPE1|nr:uncharacterized protein HMPREF1541_02847 [Cyphellophora europaea CBS 101466]ETN43688.1 hypothetical protein HMPREF1541_02847 [Cyphellophora europaea CBS 101466]